MKKKQVIRLKDAKYFGEVNKKGIPNTITPTITNGTPSKYGGTFSIHGRNCQQSAGIMYIISNPKPKKQVGLANPSGLRNERIQIKLHITSAKNPVSKISSMTGLSYFKGLSRKEFDLIFF